MGLFQCSYICLNTERNHAQNFEFLIRKLFVAVHTISYVSPVKSSLSSLPSFMSNSNAGMSVLLRATIGHVKYLIPVRPRFTFLKSM